MLNQEIEGLTAKIKELVDAYDRFIGPNGWKHPQAEIMRQEITALVNRRCDLEDSQRETEPKP